MVLSMTGYGRAEEVLNGRDITLEIKSVNHRYFEYNSRMPRAYGYVDDRMKKQLGGAISRGKVEVGLQVQNISAEDTTVSVNMDLARGYLTAMRQMATELSIKDDVTANSMARFNDIFATRKNEQDEELIWHDIQNVLNEAIEKFVAMRAIEGEKLKEDVLSRLITIESTLTVLEQTSAERVQKYTEKMYTRLKTLLEDVVIDEARVLTEAAIFADKTAVDEETVRLRSHIKQYREILETGGPVGRKLDFLTQEINREVNTIGSKAQDLAITRMVVDMKAEIEKIREQIQNME